MRPYVLTSEHFKQLNEDGAQFEELVARLLSAMGFRLLEKPAVGAEGGRDILVERTLRDELSERRERVVVQCKHRAHSGRSVGDADVGVWQQAMTRYRARGYLLVTDTRVTENLAKSFREFTEDESSTSRWADSWNVDTLILHLSKYTDVRRAFFGEPADSSTPITSLAAELSMWLEVTRHSVAAPRVLDERTIELSAEFAHGPIIQRTLVWCIGGMTTPLDVQKLARSLTHTVSQGWLISDKRVAPTAVDEANKLGNIRVHTLPEFLADVVWRPYFQELRRLIEADQIALRYVDVGCYSLEVDKDGYEIGRENFRSLEAFVDGWLKERGKVHLSLLGDFGSGKTWFCRHLAYRQLQRYLADPIGERIPILISLRTFAKAISTRQLINDAFIEHYKLEFVGSAFDLLRQLSRRGKVLLILDGFDEMARKVDYQTVVNNFWLLAELVEDDGKVILTSRTEYFRWAKESERVFAGLDTHSSHKLHLSAPRFEVIHTSPFTWKQARKAIEVRLGPERAKEVLGVISANENLQELTRKPVLIDLLITVLDEDQPLPLNNLADVYLHATSKLLLRNITTEKTFTSMSQKLLFLCELAWEMIIGATLRIHFRDIPERIRKHFVDKIGDIHELDVWDYDLRSQTLLHRDAAGYYEFAHKSMAEYFVALRLAVRLACLDERFLRGYAEANGASASILLSTTLDGVVQDLDLIPLTDERMQAVTGFLTDMLDPSAADKFWALLRLPEGPEKSTGYAAANLLTLLNLVDASFENKTMDRLALRGASLDRARLQGASMTASDLREARLSHAYLASARLVGADLTGAIITHIGGVKSLAFDPSGSVLASGSSEGTLELRELSAEGRVTALARYPDSVDCLIWTSDGERLVVGTEAGKVDVWNIPGRFVEWSSNFYYHVNLALSPDAQTLAISSWADGRIGLWDMKRHSLIGAIHNAACYRGYEAQFSPTGEYIIAANVEHGAAVWKPDGTLVRTLEQHTSKVECAAFTADGRHVVTAGYDGFIKLWDTEQWLQVGELSEGDTIPAILCTPAGNVVVATHAGQISSWSVRSLERDCSFSAHEGSIFALTHSSSAELLATGGLDATIRVWRTADWKLLREFSTSLRYDGLDLRGAKGLRKDHLQLLRARGASLDSEQLELMLAADEDNEDAG